MRHMTGDDGLGVPAGRGSGTGRCTAARLLRRCPKDYDRAHALDVAQLFAFLRATQPEAFKKLAMADAHDPKDINRLKFLARLRARSASAASSTCCATASSTARCTSTFLRHAVAGQRQGRGAATRSNRFSVTRQLRYSRDETQRALDLCLFINGLPVATFELKNSLTKQTVDDAVEQYKRDRDPRERLFEFGRCVVHFAVDDDEVRFCTQLKGKASWFLPFNQGWNDGAGNPPNPDGLKTDYLWKEILTPRGLTDILENYAQIVEERTRRPARRSASQIFPRYHQLDVVRQAARRCAATRRRQALPDPALGRQRQVELDRLARAPADRAARRDEQARLRLDHRRHRPAHPRPADPRHHQAVRAGRRDGRPRRRTRASCASSSRAARRSSSRRCRSSRSSWTRSATSTAAGTSRSSSTRRTRARAGETRPR